MVSFQDVLTFLLFGMESFHFIGHCLIMFRVRQLPRKDFVRLRFYFLVDPLSVFLSSFVVLGKLQWLTSIQLLQHLYYFLMWEQTDAAKKVQMDAIIIWHINIELHSISTIRKYRIIHNFGYFDEKLYNPETPTSFRELWKSHCFFQHKLHMNINVRENRRVYQQWPIKVQRQH